MSFAPHNFRLRPIEVKDNLSKLSLGKENYAPLKIFLRKAALNFHQHNVAKTYVLVDEEVSARVWGYITLMSSEIILNENQRPKEMYASTRYEAFPAVKIARLAIDKELQGQGYGKGILEWTITLVRDKIATYIGCRFLVVDAKQDSISFYKKAGFSLFNVEVSDEHPPMFLDLYHVT
jgi:GNAT superfamily N-acetyltransferase